MIVGNTSLEPSAEERTAELRLAAMNYLARREHSAQELCEKLAARCENPGIVSAVVERLAAQGLQSDERFVESFVRSRFQQGKGPLKITQELRQKGVSERLVEQKLEAFDANWGQLARDVRTKRFGPQLPENPKAKAKQLRFLQYRGFTPDQAYTALESS